MLKVRLYLDPSDGGKTRQIAHANIFKHRHGRPRARRLLRPFLPGP